MEAKVTLVVILLGVCSAHTVSSFEKISKQTILPFNSANVQMEASPNVLTEAGMVVVNWKGVQNPNDDDWIGVYSPSTVNTTTTSPVKYQLANVSPDYLNTGAGSLTFRLINIRDDYIFVFMKTNQGDTEPVGKSNTVNFVDYNEPLYGHISIGYSDSEMKVTWVSKQLSNPVVKFGTSQQSTTTIKATTTTYTKNDLCGFPANDFGFRDPGYIHSATLSNLMPQQQYYYSYGDDYGMSVFNSFVAPPVATASQGVHLIAYGDMGKASIDGSLEHWEEFPSLNTTRNVISKLNEIDLVLHIGDISYAVGYEAQWDQFFEQVEPITSTKPYMTCIGNHERDYPDSGAYYNGTDSGGECGVPYEHYLAMPTPGTDKPWYSFNYGNIHFLLMSTEHEFHDKSEQYEFLVNDLKNVNRTQTPWVIFAGHRPMYIDSTNDKQPDGDLVVAKLLRKELEDVLRKHKVDLALWGHHHSYQRTCPVYEEKCVDHGVVHVVIGMAGMGLSQNLQKETPEWITYVDDQNFGFTQMKTTENKLEMWYYTNDLQLNDHFTLSKK